jgi:DNA-binding transcriptional LysR family regulator
MEGIDLNDVAVFVRVAEGGGLTPAARALGVPKSTVSRSLARLEQGLGVRLVQRTTRALALTDAGRSYFERVKDAVAGVVAACEAATDMGKDPRGTVRVTAPADLGTTLLADVVARFVEKYPQVRVEVSLTNRVVDLVAEGFDLAVRAAALTDSSLVARRLGASDMGLFASLAYLRRRGKPSMVADLAAHEFIVFRPLVGASGQLVLSGREGERRVTVQGPIVADDMLFVRQLVVSGAGIGLIPIFEPTFERMSEPGCAPLAERGDTTRVLAGWAVRGHALHVVAPSARHEPRRVRLFRDVLLAEARRRGFGA